MVPMCTPRKPRQRFLRIGAALWVGLSWWAGCLCARAQTSPATDAQRNPAQMMLFHQHAEDFKGGRQLAVTVYISAFTWNGLSAMGLYETVPAGWTYGGARAVAGTMPSVTPKNGDSGVLQFLWVEQSTAPITFQYLLNIPPRESGTRVLSGQVEYRQGEGALTSNVAFSQVTGVADALPVVTLRGGTTVKISLNGGFTDPGATASDAEDGDISNKIEVAGTVDASEPGTYTLTYGVTDSVGNQSVPVSRQVTVSDTPAESGGGSTDGEKPDQGGSSGAGGAALPVSQGTLARKTAEQTRAFPPIKIPDVTLHENKGEFEIPVKNNDGTVGENGGTGNDGVSQIGSDAIRAAGDGGGMLASDNPNRLGAIGTRSGAGGGTVETEAPRRPWVLAAVGLLTGTCLIVAWHQSRGSARRTPRSR